MKTWAKMTVLRSKSRRLPRHQPDTQNARWRIHLAFFFWWAEEGSNL